MRNPVPLILLVLAAACGDGKADAVKKLQEMEQTGSANHIVPLLRFGMPLEVELPAGLPAGHLDQAVSWDDNTGSLRVAAGERFGLAIAEEPADFARLKATLDRDMLRRHTIIEESPTHVIYRSQFPDEDLVFVHFMRTIQVNGRSFTIESLPQGRFSEADVAAMMRAVRPAIAT
jgi:hypothetical protein